MIKIVEKMKAVVNGGLEAFTFKTSFLIKNPQLDISYYTDIKPATAKYDNECSTLGRHINISSAKTSNCGKLTKKIRMYKAFYRFCKKNKPDIVHVHMSSPLDLLEGAAASAAGVKNIILHSHSGDRPNAGLIKRIAFAVCRMIIKTKDYRLLACSEAAAEFMFRKEKAVIIKNGIMTDEFSYSNEIRNAQRLKLSDSNPFIIGNVGRLCSNKNQSFLLDIFSEFLKTHSNSILVIAGDGELSDSLRKKAKALDISEKVVFCGSVDNVSALYQAFDCFVFPSLSEGLGIAAVEAQTSGLITVCSDGVPKEAAVTELCSFMPLSASPKEWAEHIISACNGYERRSYAEEIKAAGYDINDTAKQLEEIYLSLE